MKNFKLKTAAGAVLVLGSAMLLSSCDNIGNENPVSPQKMEEIRKSQADQRGSFNPGNTAPPPNSAPGR